LTSTSTSTSTSASASASASISTSASAFASAFAFTSVFVFISPALIFQACSSQITGAFLFIALTLFLICFLPFSETLYKIII